MATREHIEIHEDKHYEYRSQRIYANGKRGERSEEGMKNLSYLVERVRSEHPDVPIHVITASEDRWIEPEEPVDPAAEDAGA
jgi:hypothetical protein